MTHDPALMFYAGFVVGTVVMGIASIWIVVSSYREKWGEWPWSKQ